MHDRTRSQFAHLLSPRHRFVCILLWVAVVIYMIGVWVLSSLGSPITDHVDATGIPDFFWHLVLYAGLCLLATAAFRTTWPTQPMWVLSMAGAGLAFSYSILDEIHQSLVPGRGIEAQDIAGNLVGVVLAAAFVILWPTVMTWQR